MKTQNVSSELQSRIAIRSHQITHLESELTDSKAQRNKLRTLILKDQLRMSRKDQVLDLKLKKVIMKEFYAQRVIDTVLGNVHSILSGGDY